MTDRRDALQRALDRVPADFDWTADDWRRIGGRVLELVAAASTDWEERRPSPAAADDAGLLFGEALPIDPVPLDALLDRIEGDVMRTAAYNGHPRWLAYIMGSPAPVSVMGAFIAAAINQNTGLWRVAPSATAIEVQTLRWISDMLRMPESTEGVFVSGGQMANIVAHAVARDAKAPWDVRRFGARGPEGKAPQLRIYASSELHYCHEQAAELLGLGRDAVARVPVDDAYRMRVDALGSMIAEDRRDGHLPIAVVGTAGTVGTGAIDPLPQLVTLASDEGLWLHVDGAYGAFAVLAEHAPPALQALAEADSVACDPHKWLFAPIDSGVVLVREPGLLEKSFAFHASYLETTDARTRIDLLERSPENSRPLRALKTWLALQALGRDGYAAMIDYNIQLAAYMEELIRKTPHLTLAAARELSIVCWRVEPDGVPPEALNDLQSQIIADIEGRGIAMISNTRLQDGGTALRACITNFRTRPEDIELVVRVSQEIGYELAAG